MRRWHGIIAALVVVGCGSKPVVTPPPEVPAPPPVAAPKSPALYELDHLLVVELTVDPADWDKLRTERHDSETVFGPNCLDGPTKRPYAYVPARLSIDGGAAVDVQIRKKGFLGSVNDTRPSLKVKLAQPVDGTKRLTLNNNQQDASQVHQCVAYRAFARAGVPAPRCSLATVSVNGTSLGVYSNVESIKRPFLRRAFGDDAGALYEGNITDFRPAWIKTMQHKNDGDGAKLDALVAALALPDDAMLPAVDALIDMDAFLTYWAMERLVGHWDGYTNDQNNFYVYRHPRDAKLRFIPWGVDSALGDPDVLSRYEAPASVYATSILPHRLYAVPAVRERYVARLRALVQAWDAAGMLADVDTLAALARPHLHVSMGAFDGGLRTVRSFIQTRRDVIEADLADGPPAWRAALRSSPCSTTNGTVTATFQTTWTDAPPLNPVAAGKVDTAIELAGAAMTFRATGVTAGETEQSQHRPTVGLFGMRDDGMLVMAFVTVEPAQFASGNTLTLDGLTTSGIVLEMNLAAGSIKLAGFLAAGTLVLTHAGMTDGDVVEGSLTADISQPAYWADPPPAAESDAN